MDQFNQAKPAQYSKLLFLTDFLSFPLNKLLDEDSFLNDFKNRNSKIMAYMNYEKYSTLVEYITVVGNHSDEKRAYKYPLLACETLSCDNPVILQFFFPSDQTEEKETEEDQLKENDEQSEGKLKEVTQNHIQQENMEKVKKIKKQNHIKKPLIHLILSYFLGQVNYTLAGYVSKVLQSFLSKKQSEVVKYIFQTNILDSMLNHIESDSVSELVGKIVAIESKQYLNARKKIVERIMQKLANNEKRQVNKHQKQILSNLASCFCGVIEKISTNAKGENYVPELYELLLGQDIIKSVMLNVIDHDKDVFKYSASILLCYLIQSTSHHEFDDSMEFLEQFMEKCLKRLEKVEKNIGMGRLKIVQIMGCLIQHNLFSARQILAREKKFVPVLINLCQNYPFNNILHNEFFKIVNSCFSLSDDDPLLFTFVQDDLFLNFLIQEASKCELMKEHERKVGYFGHLVKICLKIDQSENEILRSIKERNEFQRVMKILVSQQQRNITRNLGGFSRKKIEENKIYFFKQEIIRANIQFLNQPTVPISDESHFTVNIKHPNVDRNEKEQSKEENKDSKMMEQKEEQVICPKYWPTHLESFSLEELMNNL